MEASSEVSVERPSRIMRTRIHSVARHRLLEPLQPRRRLPAACLGVPAALPSEEEPRHNPPHSEDPARRLHSELEEGISRLRDLDFSRTTPTHRLNPPPGSEARLVLDHPQRSEPQLGLDPRPRLEQLRLWEARPRDLLSAVARLLEEPQPSALRPRMPQPSAQLRARLRLSEQRRVRPPSGPWPRGQRRHLEEEEDPALEHRPVPRPRGSSSIHGDNILTIIDIETCFDNYVFLANVFERTEKYFFRGQITQQCSCCCGARS